MNAPVRRLRRGLVGLVVVAAASLGLVVPAAAEAAVSTLPVRALDVTDPRSMAYAKGSLFVTGGDEVVVLDTRGAVRRRLTDLPGTYGVEASPSGDQVYVALRDASAIAVIDTSSLAVRRIAVDACPFDLAFVGGRLFYSAGCGSWATISSVDPNTSDAPRPSGTTDFFYGAPQLVGGGDVLAASYGGESPATVFTYRVTGSKATALGKKTADTSVEGLAVSPDGSTVYVAAGVPFRLRTYDASMTPRSLTYEPGEAAVGVAVSADGALIATGSSAQDANLRVFRRGEPAAVVAGSAHPTEEYNQPLPVAWTVTMAPDGSRAFAVVGRYGQPHYLTSTPTRAGLPASPLSVDVEQPTTAGGTARLTAVLTGRAGVEVDFHVATTDGTRLVAVETDADGRAVLEQFLPGGTQVYASYDGDDEHQAAQTDQVTVLDRTALTLELTPPPGHSGSLTMTATLTPALADATVSFVISQPGEPDVTPAVWTDAHGVATLAWDVTGGGTVRAEYGGDDKHQGSTSEPVAWEAKSPSKTHVELWGKHKTKHHTLYYTKASRVHADVWVDPRTASEVDVVLQKRSGKHWKTLDETTEALEDGEVTLQLDSAPKRTDLRFVATYAGDDDDSASKGTSKTFRIG